MTDTTRTDQKTDQEFTPIETQEDLDRIISKRIKDYKDLQAQLQQKDEQIDSLKAEIDRAEKRHTLDRELAERGIRDESRAQRIKKLIDLDGGDPTEQLEALSKDVPELFRTPRGVGSGGSSKPVLPKDEPLTREEIEAMSPEQLNKPGIREKVDAFLRGER